MQAIRSSSAPSPNRRWWRLLLLVPLVGTLWVPWYNHVDPSFIGLPFFYWYLLLWVPISALLSAFVYFQTRDLD